MGFGGNLEAITETLSYREGHIVLNGFSVCFEMNQVGQEPNCARSTEV